MFSRSHVNRGLSLPIRCTLRCPQVFRQSPSQHRNLERVKQGHRPVKPPRGGVRFPQPPFYALLNWGRAALPLQEGPELRRGPALSTEFRWDLVVRWTRPGSKCAETKKMSTSNATPYWLLLRYHTRTWASEGILCNRFFLKSNRSVRGSSFTYLHHHTLQTKPVNIFQLLSLNLQQNSSNDQLTNISGRKSLTSGSFTRLFHGGSQLLHCPWMPRRKIYPKVFQLRANDLLLICVSLMRA